MGDKRFTSFASRSKELSNSEKQTVVDYVKSFVSNTSEYVAAAMEIIEHSPKYCNMDLPTAKRAQVREIRDVYMANNIVKQCNNVDDFVVALVGGNHFSVANRLKASGKEVSEVWRLGEVEGVAKEDRMSFCILDPQELSDVEHKNLCVNYTGNAKVFDTTESKMDPQDIANKIIPCVQSSAVCTVLHDVSDVLYNLVGCTSECTMPFMNEDL